MIVDSDPRPRVEEFKAVKDWLRHWAAVSLGRDVVIDVEAVRANVRRVLTSGDLPKPDLRSNAGPHPIK